MPPQFARRTHDKVPRRILYFTALSALQRDCLPECEDMVPLSQMHSKTFKTTRLRPEIWAIIEVLKARFKQSRKVDLSVALLILKGHSSVSAALRLGVAAQTVKVFRKQLYSRCRISSQAELFALMLPLLKGVV